MLQNDQITERIKKLILQNKVSDYYVWKNAHIPKSSFSNMINNNSEWKLEYIASIAVLFNVEIEWLIFGKANYIIQELVKENKSLYDEVLVLREKVATYEVAAKKASEIKVKKKHKSN